ncbi:MAG: peptide deformylase, partial [Geminicoccaceae bacterium]|nr:peptide deformylase [Geminicoccaceae bacterium]
ETAVAALRAAGAPGIAGLAAPQLGLSVRVIAVMEGDACRIFLNPEILVRSPRVVRGQEACLSLPHVTAEVDRAAEIVFRAFDPERGEVTLGAEGWLAAVVQHEVDHLDGILFIDRLSQAERKLALREAARLRQQLAEKPALILPAA